MYYVVEKNVFREPNYDNLIASLKRLQLSYEIVELLPFMDTVKFRTDRKDVFVFGCMKLSRIAHKYGWVPGSLMGENNDYVVYAPHWGENLLNHDSVVQRVADGIDWSDGIKFIRPCKDSKAFSGKIFSQEEWDEMVSLALSGDSYYSGLDNDTEVQVAYPKRIQKEIRCWVVDGKVVTASQYKLGTRVVLDDNIEEPALDFAQSMVDIFQLAKAFVIDVCLTDDKWKIVEAGCINCAGFYKADLQKVLIALEDAWER